MYRYLLDLKHGAGYLTGPIAEAQALGVGEASEIITQELVRRFGYEPDWEVADLFYSTDNGAIIDMTNPINSVF